MNESNDKAPDPVSPKETIILSATVPSSEKPGDRIGHYKLLQEIGEGGMGTVWMAEQQVPVRRRVALKVIKLGMDTRQVIGRFEAERQALALMDHPNIAKVLDAGSTENGRPFFVMELVKGIPITEYCDKEKLSTQDRLNLFVQVCHAIQHAHQKGIIHRDIKPSNILVTLNDGKPSPRVIDFGIAKATDGQSLTDKTAFTAMGQFIGTPAYMSPEQAGMNSADIDTRSDIYALGVLLYELLTGKTPFDSKALVAKGLDEIRRIIREEEPPRPSTRLSTLDGGERTKLARCRGCESPKLVGLIRGDLDWVVMKCLEKDRRRRYETATGLLIDVERHLHHEPVIARPPTNFYRFQKLVLRNKLAVAAAASVITALTLGLAVSTWMFVRERSARERAVAAELAESKLRQQAEAERQKADNARIVAEQNLDDARSAIDQFQTRAGRFRFANVSGAYELQEQMFLDAIAFCERLLSRTTNSVPLRKKLASSHGELGQLAGIQGKLDFALEHNLTRIDLLERLAAESPDDVGSKTSLAGAYWNQARFLERKGDLAASMNFAARSTTVWHEVLRFQPANQEVKSKLVEQEVFVSELRRNLGDLQEALSLANASVRELEEMVAKDPDSNLHLRRLAFACGKLGDLKWDNGESAEARRLWERAAKMAWDLAVTSQMATPAVFDAAVVQTELGQLLRRLKDYPAAELAFQSARRISEDMVRANPNVDKYQRSLARQDGELGATHLEQQQVELASKLIQASCTAFENLVQRNPGDNELKYDCVTAWVLVAEAAAAAMDGGKATNALNQARQLFSTLPDKDTKSRRILLLRYKIEFAAGNALKCSARIQEATEAYGTALNLARQLPEKRRNDRIRLEAAEAAIHQLADLSVHETTPSPTTAALPQSKNSTAPTLPVENQQESSPPHSSEANQEFLVSNRSEILKLAGSVSRVRGWVRDVKTTSSGRITLITFADAGPNGFTALVYGGELDAFTKAFGGDLYSVWVGREVRVTGQITTYRNAPQIILNRPGQIQLLTKPPETHP